MFINKIIYKTSNFKEKKDRFFTVFVSFKITSRHTNTMIEYKFWIPYQIVEKVTTFSNRKKTSHQTFCFFIVFTYHKQSTHVYIMLTFLALGKICFRDIQFLCNPDWEVPSLTSMSFMKPQEQRNIFNIPKRKTEAKVRLSYLHLWFCTSLRHGVPRHHR